MNASDLKKVNLVQLFLEYGADPNKTADVSLFMYACTCSVASIYACQYRKGGLL